MDSCPACTASLVRNGKVHCPSPTCVWIKCGTCKTVIDTDSARYWDNERLVWGDHDGYLKAS